MGLFIGLVVLAGLIVFVFLRTRKSNDNSSVGSFGGKKHKK